MMQTHGQTVPLGKFQWIQYPLQNPHAYRSDQMNPNEVDVSVSHWSAQVDVDETPFQPFPTPQSGINGYQWHWWYACDTRGNNALIHKQRVQTNQGTCLKRLDPGLLILFTQVPFFHSLQFWRTKLQLGLKLQWSIDSTNQQQTPAVHSYIIYIYNHLISVFTIHSFRF